MDVVIELRFSTDPNSTKLPLTQGPINYWNWIQHIDSIVRSIGCIYWLHIILEWKIPGWLLLSFIHGPFINFTWIAESDQNCCKSSLHLASITSKGCNIHHKGREGCDEMGEEFDALKKGREGAGDIDSVGFDGTDFCWFIFSFIFCYALLCWLCCRRQSWGRGLYPQSNCCWLQWQQIWQWWWWLQWCC